MVALPPALATKRMGGPERGHGQGPQHRLASFGNGGCARLSFRNGAISLHTRSSVFENFELGGHLTGEDESLAPTHCSDERVIACSCVVPFG